MIIEAIAHRSDAYRTRWSGESSPPVEGCEHALPISAAGAGAARMEP